VFTSAHAMTSFLEESPGVWSSTRAVMGCLCGMVVLVVNVTCIYVLTTAEPQAAVIAALAGLVTALVFNGVVAIIRRNPPEAAEPEK
jgi:hypothetical protein